MNNIFRHVIDRSIIIEYNISKGEDLNKDRKLVGEIGSPQQLEQRN